MADVRLCNLTKSFGDNVVVDHVNMDIPNGMLVSILGPSGCGKTTLLRLIAGFETPDEGDILFDGKSVTGIPPRKRNIGMVFQSYALFPHMTVEENVSYGLKQRRLSNAKIKDKVDRVLETVHMTQYRKRKPRQLSGGQQQRVALARALAISPKLLLLDESLSALDKKLRVEMQIELRRILEESRVTTFFVTHDQEEAMTLSDYIVVMNAGVIEQMGTPEEVYEKPKNRFVAGFLGSANFFKSSDGTEFAVRPEKVRIGIRPAGEIRKEGVIAYITYSGNVTSYRIQCKDGIVICEKQNTHIEEQLSLGQNVFLFWDKSSEIIMAGQR